MIVSWQRTAAITSGVVLSFAVHQVNPAQAAIVNYNLAGTIDNGLLTGQTFSGTFSYDDSLLTGSGFDPLGVSQVNLSFLGSTFTAVDDDSFPDDGPKVEFLDGNFLGLNFTVSSFTPEFSLIPAFGTTEATVSSFTLEFSLIPAFGTTEATFFYIGTDDDGSGSIQYTLSATVPEPSTVLGLIALGIGGFLVSRKREYH